jgi:hypothetical protein
MKNALQGLLVLVLAAAGAGCASASPERLLGAPFEMAIVAADRVLTAPFVALGAERRSEDLHESVFLSKMEPDGFVKDEIAEERGGLPAISQVVAAPFECLGLFFDRLSLALPLGEREPGERRVVDSIFKDPEAARAAREAREAEKRRGDAVARAAPRPSD